MQMLHIKLRKKWGAIHPCQKKYQGPFTHISNLMLIMTNLLMSDPVPQTSKKQRCSNTGVEIWAWLLFLLHKRTKAQ